MQRSIVKSIEFHTKIKGNHQNRVMKSRKSGDEIRSNPINLMNRTPKYILMAYVCAHRQVPIGVLIHIHCICMRTQATPISD